MSNKYDFKFTPHAVESIDKVFYYIAEILHNEKAAKDLLSDVENAIDNACLFPYAAADFSIFKKLIINKYLLFYSINEDNKQIEILKLVYAGVDLNKVEI